VSSQHGKVGRTRRGWVYKDLFSTNGTQVVRGAKTIQLDAAGKQRAILEDGDILRVGDPEQAVVLRVRIADDVADADPGVIRAVRKLADVDALARGVADDPGRLKALHGATRKIAQAMELDEVLAATADAVFDLLPSATHFGIFLKEDDDRFVPYLGRAGKDRETEAILSRTLQRRVLADGAGVLASNAPEELGTAASIMAAEIQSTLCVPLWRGDSIHGLLQVDNRTARGVFREDDLELLTVLAAQVSHAVRHAQVYARLAQAEASARKENRYLKGRDQQRGRGPIIGESPAWLAVMAQVSKVQATRVPVCLIGDTGTGKEVVARAVH
jgi:Nif-specific regulatory protein